MEYRRHSCNRFNSHEILKFSRLLCNYRYGTTTTFIKRLFQRTSSCFTFQLENRIGQINVKYTRRRYRHSVPSRPIYSNPPLSPPHSSSGPFFLRSPAISNWATQFPSFASREKFPDCASRHRRRRRCHRQITKPLTMFDAPAATTAT